MLRKVLRILGPAVGLAIFAGAMYLLYRELRAYDPRDILRHVQSLPVPAVLLALACALASYAGATGYDALGARYALGRGLSYGKTARAAFASTSISNGAGFGLLTGGSVRYRMYSGWGLAPAEIARIIGFYTLSLWLGFLALGGVLSAIVPPVLAVSLFVGGIVLLVSGATPAVLSRLHLLRGFLPLPFIEASHFLGSIVGILMLFLARGVQRRIDSAYPLSIALLLAGIVLSLAKGFDYEEAVILAVVLLAMLPCGRFFYRRSSILSGGLTTPWVAGIVVVVLGTAWITLYAHRHVQFSGELVWQFMLDSHAPRSLRALAGAAVVALGVGAALLVRPAMRARPAAAPLELTKHPRTRYNQTEPQAHHSSV